MVSPTLLILAAGTGSRYGGIKLVEPVGPNGESIVDYSIFDARRAGFGRVVLVIRRDMELAIKERMTARYAKHFPVEYVFQDLAKLPAGFRLPVGRTKPWGTTHAILMAANAIHEPFAAINVADFYGAGSFRALAHHLQSGTTDCAMPGFVLRNTLSEWGAVARGICQVRDDGYLENLVELKSIERAGGRAKSTDAAGVETKLTGDEVVSMNMWGFPPTIFEPLRDQFQRFLKEHENEASSECVLPSTVNEMVMAGQARVKVLHCGETWFGVTYPEDQTRAVESVRHLIEGGYYPRKIW
jgi:dTDP-glucose pyrophosphorylase